MLFVFVCVTGGLGAVVLDNVTFIGPSFSGIGMNHHCALPGTGMLCTPEYQLINVSFDGLRPVYPNEPPAKRILFGHSSGEPTLPMITARDGSLPYNSMASGEQWHLLGLPNGVCRRLAGDEAIAYDGAIACDVPLRRLQVWSERQAKMRLVGPGSPSGFDMKFIDDPFAARKRGYGVPIAVGFSYRLEMSDGDVTIEFSDAFYGTKFGFPADEIDLVVAIDGKEERRCGTVTSQHDRSFIDFEYGPLSSKRRGEMGACVAGSASSMSSARLRSGATARRGAPATASRGVSSSGVPRRVGRMVARSTAPRTASRADFSGPEDEEED